MKLLNDLLEHLKGKDIWWGIVTIMILVNVAGMGWYSLMTGKSMSGFPAMVVVQMISFLTMLLGFRYGSSKGSKEKDKLTNNKPGGDA